MKFIKKSLFSLVLLVLLALFLSGCLNYKAYESNSTEDNDSNLLQEIAEIEKELNLSVNATPKANVTVEEPKPDPAKVTMSLKNETTDKSKLNKIYVNESSMVDLRVKIVDPDNDTISYSFSKPLNEIGKWQTNYGDAGEYVITITATDGKLTSAKDVLLVVQKVNVPPKIKEIANINIKEGETVKIEPQVTDPNGDKVTVKISDPLSAGSWGTDHTSAGEYVITITASDGEKESKTSFLLTVLDVNVPPNITGVSDLTIKEGEKLEIKPVVTDLDKDTINVTISEPVGNDGFWETTYTSHGIYNIVITADDGKDKVTKSIKLTVEDVNMPPVINDIKLG